MRTQPVSASSWFRGRTGRESLRPGADEIVALLRRYLIQETVGPLKRIARGFLGALGGAVLFAFGGIVVLVGVLRMLQGETGGAFTGNWSFVPYVITAFAGVGLIGLASLVTVRSLSLSGSTRP